jgi:hypothetical protein
MIHNKEYLDSLKEGLIDIVRNILIKVSNYGLEGKQNLIIRFYNHFDNNYLFEDQFTTITIQSNNQDLYCDNDKFSVNIKINGLNKRITVPLNAVALILDPSARFGLELGQVYDDYKLQSVQENPLPKKSIEFINNSTIIFNEHININKYNFSDSKLVDYQMDYIEITRNCLITVIKSLLTKLINNQINKKKTFLIEFQKNYPGVVFPVKLNKRRNSDLITISLREKFFNLNVNEKDFSVILSFDTKLQQIIIPYKAITNFFDPDCKFKIELNFIDFIDEQIIEKNKDKITYIKFD